MTRLVHDPELARQVFNVFSRLSGRTGSSSYSIWLRNYVFPMARAAGFELVRPRPRPSRKAWGGQG